MHMAHHLHGYTVHQLYQAFYSPTNAHASSVLWLHNMTCVCAHTGLTGHIMQP